MKQKTHLFTPFPHPSIGLILIEHHFLSLSWFLALWHQVFWGKFCQYAHFLFGKLILLSISFAYSSASFTSTQATFFLPAKILLLSLSAFPTIASTVFRIKNMTFHYFDYPNKKQLKILPHHYWWLSFLKNCNNELFSSHHPNCYTNLMKWFLCFDTIPLFSTPCWGGILCLHLDLLNHYLFLCFWVDRCVVPTDISWSQSIKPSPKLKVSLMTGNLHSHGLGGVAVVDV